MFDEFWKTFLGMLIVCLAIPTIGNRRHRTRDFWVGFALAAFCGNGVANFIGWIGRSL